MVQINDWYSHTNSILKVVLKQKMFNNTSFSNYIIIEEYIRYLNIKIYAKYEIRNTSTREAFITVMIKHFHFLNNTDRKILERGYLIFGV